MYICIFVYMYICIYIYIYSIVIAKKIEEEFPSKLHDKAMSSLLRMSIYYLKCTDVAPMLNDFHYWCVWETRGYQKFGRGDIP